MKLILIRLQILIIILSFLSFILYIIQENNFLSLIYAFILILNIITLIIYKKGVNKK